MKISDCITSYQLTGECGIDVDNLVRCFGKSFIYHHDASDHTNQYRLVNRRAGVKCTISKKDALSIISRLNLVGVRHPIFVLAITYRKAQ